VSVTDAELRLRVAGLTLLPCGGGVTSRCLATGEEMLMQILQSRRDFLASLSAAATAGILGTNGSLADEGPPETTTLRLAYWPNICLAPGDIADDLLRAEGFTDIRRTPPKHINSVARGEIDFDFETAAWVVSQVDAGEPITALAGVQPGCYELFANEPIRTISDLQGKKVGIEYPGSSGHLILTLMAAQVGLDPHTDINWVTKSNGDFMEAFARREVDAFLGLPPEPQELRARNIGRVILNTTTDRPWSQYFCCIEFGNRDFVRAHPIATKRYLRALLKAADLCATEPETAAQRLVEGGFTGRYDYAFQALTELPYAKWREFDPADAMRFYALRLHEVGMIGSSPNALLAEGTGWRFLNELKRELKA
jgi:NitT/TauT family transport system substrate-binding protein